MRIYSFPFNLFIILRGCFYTFLHLYFPGVGFVVLVLFCFGFAVVQYVFGFAFRYFGQLFIAGKCIPSGSTGAIKTTNSTKMYLLWQQQQFQQFRIIFGLCEHTPSLPAHGSCCRGMRNVGMTYTTTSWVLLTKRKEF